MRTVIVTGASGNMGQAVVRKFLAEGCRVTGTIIPNDPVELNISDKNFETSTADLLNDSEAAELVATVIKKYGAIDVAVLTVGGFAMGDIASTTSTDLMQQYRLNFETAYHVARPVFAQMLRQGSGRIFLIGSRPGQDMHNSKGMVAYGLTKSLLFRLAELMNEEAKETPVFTSVIIPSTIDTPQNRASMPNADFSKWVTPGAIADTIYRHAREGSPVKEPVIEIYGNV